MGQKVVAFVAAAGLAVGVALAAAPGTYQVDGVHSSVLFRVGHLGVGHVYGRFNQVTGTVVEDTENPANSKVTAEVQAASIDTGNEMRDKDLRSARFFDVEQCPTIAFASTAVSKVDDNHLQVTGDLTLHGVTKPITITVERQGTGKGMKGETRSAWETRFSLKRSDYGMTQMIPAAGDEVELTVAFEAVQK